MVKRFLGFLVLAGLLLAVGGLFYLNPAVVELRITSTRTVSLPLPLLVMASVLAGAAAIFVLALVREAQWTLADRRRRKSQAVAERARALVAAGRDLLWHGHPERAKRVLRRAPSDHHDVESLALLGETSLAGDRTDEARMVVDDALAVHPDHPRLLALRAAVAAREREWRSATNLLERAVALEPESRRLVASLRDAYARERRWAEAVRTEDRYLALLRRPDEVAAERTRVLGLRYELALDHSSADEWVQELYTLLRRDPAFLPAAISLGETLQHLGRLREAVRVWVRMARLRPTPVLLKRLEALYRELGRPQKMVTLYRRLRRRSDSSFLALRLVHFLLAEGALDEAAAELDAVEPAVADGAEVRLLRGEIERLRGHDELALEALRAAFDCTRGDPLAHFCTACGRSARDWTARCSACGAWDTLEAELGPSVAQERPNR